MYHFPQINVSDRSFFGIHSFWGRSGSTGWSPIIGMKQVEPPYLYGYAFRVARTFIGVCRERQEKRPLIRPLDIDTEEIIEWGSESTNESQNNRVQPLQS